MPLLDTDEKKTKLHTISAPGLVAECNCGFIERWREHWQAVASAFEHARQVKAAGLDVEYGEGLES